MRVSKVLVSALACVELLGCATEVAAPSTSSTEETIWSPVVGAHKTAKTAQWTPVSTSITGPYALTSTSAGAPAKTTLRMFYRDANNCLHHRWQFDGDAGWYEDGALHSCDDFGSPVAATAWSSSRYDLFYFSYSLIGGNPHLEHLFWNGTAWIAEDLGATSTAGAGAPMVGSWANGHLDVFWRDDAGNLRQRIFDRAKKNAPGFDGTGWQRVDTLAIPYFPPYGGSIAEPTTGEIDIAYKNGVGKLTVQTSKDGGATWTANNPGFTLDGPPALASWGPDHLVALAYRKSATSAPLRQFTRDASGWHDLGMASELAVGTLVAAASPSRANRLDVLGLDLASPSTGLQQTFYQESLPGFAELYNPETQYWCWANATGVIINYLMRGTYGWTPKATCDYVGTTLGYNCCGALVDPSCYTTGDHSDVYDAYNVTVGDSGIYTFDQIRYDLAVNHLPVLVHESHNNDSGNHVVVIHEAFRLGGVEYVSIADPGDNGATWTWPYSTLMAYNGNWHVDYMERGFAITL